MAASVQHAQPLRTSLREGGRSSGRPTDLHCGTGEATVCDPSGVRATHPHHELFAGRPELRSTSSERGRRGGALQGQIFSGCSSEARWTHIPQGDSGDGVTLEGGTDKAVELPLDANYSHEGH